MTLPLSTVVLIFRVANAIATGLATALASDSGAARRITPEGYARISRAGWTILRGEGVTEDPGVIP